MALISSSNNITLNVKLHLYFDLLSACLLFAKKRLPYPLCSNIIYILMYSGLSTTHYGKKICNILNFYREHLGINESGKEVESYSPFSIKEHICKTKHTASFDDLSVLSRNDDSFNLLIHESLLTHRDRPSLPSHCPYANLFSRPFSAFC